MRTDLFPFVMTRIGNCDFRELSSFNFSDIDLVLNDLIHLEKVSKEMRDELCNELFNLIKIEQDDSKRNKLLNIKRDLFNNRFSDSDIIPAHLTDRVNELRILSQKEKVITQEASEKLILQKESVYESVLRTSILNNPLILNGLVSASNDLLSEISKYQSKNLSPQKKARFESSFFKYFSRICTKTSPFSTFTSISFNPVQESNVKKEHPSISAVHCHFTLNNLLFKLITDIMFSHGEIYGLIPLQINTTLVQLDDTFEFMNNINNVEVFQSIPFDDPIISLVGYLEAGPLTHTELINNLIDEYEIEASIAVAYVNKLIEAGLFHFSISISGNDPKWLPKLIKFTNSLQPNDSLRLLMQILNDLQKNFNSLHATDHWKKRLSILRQTHVSFVGEIKKLLTTTDNYRLSLDYIHNYLSTIKPEQLYFEDSYRDSTIPFEKKDLASISQIINEFMSVQLNTSTNAVEQINMYAHFKTEFGIEKSDIGLLEFYRSYYQKVKCPEAEWLEQNPNSTNPFESPEVIELRQLQKEWNSKSVDKILSTSFNIPENTINIRCEDLRSISKEFPDTFPILKFPGSWGCMFQPATLKNQKYFVINSIFAGYGKMTSRFMFMAPSIVLSELKRHNQQLESHDHVFIENTDNNYFNANIHPLLLDKEISFPGSQNQADPENRIKCSDLLIRANHKTKSIHLIHLPSNKSLSVIDMGFGSLKQRSELFRLLNTFGLTRLPPYQQLLDNINIMALRHQTGNPKRKEFPLIMVEDKLILQRKKWVYARPDVPIKTSTDNDSSYFIKLNKWIFEQSLPKQFYFRLQTSDQQKFLNVLYKSDDYKPQYIDVRNPYLCRILEKLLHKNYEMVSFESAVPSSTDYLNSENVVEFLLQWYNNHE